MRGFKLDESQGTATSLLAASVCTDKSIKLYFESLSLTEKTTQIKTNKTPTFSKKYVDSV